MSRSVNDPERVRTVEGDNVPVMQIIHVMDDNVLPAEAREIFCGVSEI